MRKLLRSIISGTLALSMALTQPVRALAEVADTLKVQTIQVEGTHFTDEIPADGKYVYFGATTVSVTEANTIYEVPIYRGGDLTEAASVTLHSLDMSALYKDDYALLGKNKKEYKSSKTLMELSATAEESGELTPVEYEFDEYGNLLTVNGKPVNATAGSLPAPNKKVTQETKAAKATASSTIAGGAGKSTVKPVPVKNSAGTAGKAAGTAGKTAAAKSTSKPKATGANLANASVKKATASSAKKKEVALINDRTDNVLTQQYLKGKKASDADLKIGAALSEEAAPEGELLGSEYDQIFAQGKSPLAILKERETGKPTREPVSTTLDPNLTDSIMKQIMPGYIGSLPYSAEQVITFEPGEAEKTVQFRIYNDKEAEGSEAFSIMIVDSEGAEPFISTSLSVVIDDDEEVVHSSISFEKGEYTAENGKVTILVKREDSVYSIATANVAGENAEGEETVFGTVAFAPYEKEKEVELYLEEDTELYLTEFTAAEEGEIITASVHVEETGTDNDTEVDEEDEEDEAGEADGDSRLSLENRLDSSLEIGNALGDEESFEIGFGGVTYKVVYEKGKTTGTILDIRFDPAVEVGRYYFSADQSNGGIYRYSKDFRTGSKPWGCGVLKCEYDRAGDTVNSESYGKIEYYHTTAWKKGQVYAESDCLPGDNAVNGLYYRYLVPDWEQKSSFGGGNKVAFEGFVKGSGSSFKKNYKGGKFSREQSGEQAIQIKNKSEMLWTRLLAVDDSGKTPKSYLKFYGFGAMYKKFRVELDNSEEMSFKVGAYDVQSLPAQFEVKCGAHLYQTGASAKRDIYANHDENVSNLVFSINDMRLTDDAVDKFCTLTGYKITISPTKDEDKQVKVNYPEDFIKFLQSRERKSTSAISYSAASVKAEVEKVNKHLDTIPMDLYFIDWIETIQKDVYSDGFGGTAYFQELAFTPVVKYNDVNVTIVEPVLDKSIGTAAFNDPALKAGETVTFHAGDTLDLGSTPANDSCRILGYEISDDNGVNFSSIRGKYSYTLRPNRNYIIRPLVEPNDNRVEVQFGSAEAKKNLLIRNLIPQADLSRDKTLRGRYILDLNPGTGKPVYERMRPVVGAVCTLNVVVTGKPAEAGYVYRPVIRDKVTGRTYNAQGYSFHARSTTADNVLILDVEKVKESDLKAYTIEGSVMSAMAAIRNDGLGRHANAVPGYTVSTPNGVGRVTNSATGQTSEYVKTVSSTTDETGMFTLSGITAKDGDRITLLVDNGFGDAQVLEYVIRGGSADDVSGVTSVSAGVLQIGYPVNAPRITSVTYDYSKSVSRRKANLNANSVRCFDDTLTLTARVDNNGRKIGKVVFQVVTVTGDTTTYEARPVTKKQWKSLLRQETIVVYEARIPKMLDNFHNGDRVNAYIVDAEKRTVSVNGDDGSTQQASMEIVYPIQETGLVMYVENEVIAPKNYNVEDSLGSVDIPLIGAMAGSAKSGVLGLSRTDWPGGMGYSISVNFDMLVYSNKAGMTPQQKMQAAKGFFDTTNDIATLKNYANAKGEENAWLGGNVNEIIRGAGGPDNLNEDEQNMIADINERIEHNKEVLKANNDGAKEAASSLTKDKKMSVHVLFVLDFEFIFDPVAQEYVMATAAITMGGGVSVSKTWYTLILYAPCYVNLTGSAEADIILGGAVPEGRKAMSEGHFDRYSGNVKDILDDSVFLWQFDMVLIGKVQAGVGLCGVLGARGYVSVGVQGQILDDNGTMKDAFTGDTKSKPHFGAALNAAGGIGIDLVLLSLDMDIAKIQKGWGSLQSVASVSFFNGMGGKIDLQNKKKDGAYSEDGGEDGIAVREYYNGTSDMSSFGRGRQSLETGRSLVNNRLLATPKLHYEEILLEDAADRTRPKILRLPDGRDFAVFIGGSGHGDSSCLYYTIGRQGGQWSTPKPVSGDGTYDSTPALALSGNQVVIAWADAAKPIEGLDDFKEQYNAFNISGATYDILSGKMSDTFKISRATDDLFFNQSPEVRALGDMAYCTYMTSDISGCETPEQLADLGGHFSTLQVAAFNLKTEEKPYEKHTAYVAVDHETVTDPLLIDFTTEILSIGETDYYLATYTVDLDRKLETMDRELYLSVTDLTNEGRTYYPIRIKDTEAGPAAPKLFTLNDGCYLTWIENGTEFALLDVRTLLDSLFNGPAVKNGAYADSDPKDAKWYIRSASELGMSGSDYEDSYYEDIADGDFREERTTLRDDIEEAGSSSEYTLVTDGQDIYLFFTDDGGDAEKPTRELYGKRFRQRKDQYEEKESGDDGDDEDVWGFTHTIRITERDSVIDDFTMVMNEDRSLRMLADVYEQDIDEDGSYQKGPTSLMNLEFAPASSLVIEDASIDSYQVVGQKAELSFTLTNNGLMDAKGYSIQASLSDTGEKVFDEHYDDVIAPGDSRTIYIPWVVPDRDLDRETMNLNVWEDYTFMPGKTVTVDLTRKEHLILEAGETEVIRFDPAYAGIDVSSTVNNPGDISLSRELLTTATITNMGSRTSEPCVAKLYNYNKYDTSRVLDTMDVPALESGESWKLYFTYAPAIEDWNQFGTIEMKILAERDEDVIDSSYDSFYMIHPFSMKLNNWKDISLTSGESKTVAFETAPWSELLDDAVFYSLDNDVAIVDNSGKITAVGKGATRIDVFSPKYGCWDRIFVTVDGGGDDNPSDDSDDSGNESGGRRSESSRDRFYFSQKEKYGTGSGGGSGSGGSSVVKPGSSATGPGLPSWVTTSGYWQKLENGTWNYVLDGSLVRDRWLCAYNPYADVARGQKAYGWFHFDGNGTMQTGWFNDVDGNRYYLNPVSDNTMGMMFTGWQFIGGRWYYFSEAEGSGYMGALYRNTVTPDGYTVGADGAWITYEGVA